MKNLALLLLLACSKPAANESCDCGSERGAVIVDVTGVQLVCERLREEAVDGGISFPDCTNATCCRWEAP